MKHYTQKAQDLWQNRDVWLAPFFFLAGFLFDVFTLDQIDAWTAQLLPIFYLLCSGFLLFDITHSPAPGRWRFDQYRNDALHFLLGSLLSTYFLYFFISSSLWISFAFILVLLALLVANESSKFQSQGLQIKFALWTVLWIFYFVAGLPILAGKVHGILVVAALLLGLAPGYLTFYLLAKKQPDRQLTFAKMILIPSGLSALSIGLAAWLGWLPAIPFALKKVYIAHEVRVTENREQYLLKIEKPWYRFWHNGDQLFAHREGEKVFVYFQIYSPLRIADDVFLEWSIKKSDWVKTDTVPIRIRGGREEGFRGYGFKTKVEMGHWRVRILTNDQREIGRIHFELVPQQQEVLTSHWITP